MSTIKSKILSLFSIFKNNGHFFVIFEVLICLCINFWYFLFVLIFYIIWLFIKNKRLMFSTLVLGIIFFTIFLVKELIYNNTSDLVIKGEVLNIQEKEYYNMLLIKANNVKYLVKTKNQYRVGDILLVNGVSEEYKIHYPNQFDYNKYLHFQNIKSVISSTEIKKCGYKFNLRIFHDNIKNYINKTFPEEVSSYINTLTIVSSDTLDSTNIDKIGISHLFVISGLHVSILILIIEKILGLFKTNKKIMIIIEIMLIGFYVILTNFLISVIRVFVSLVLKRMTKIKGLDQISLNFIIVTLINPFNAFSISFILSYIIAFFMALYSNFIKINLKNKLLSKISFNTLINLLSVDVNRNGLINDTEVRKLVYAKCFNIDTIKANIKLSDEIAQKTVEVLQYCETIIEDKDIIKEYLESIFDNDKKRNDICKYRLTFIRNQFNLLFCAWG